MEIREVTENKKKYLPLLLLADEQEDMIDRYLDRGTMYVLSVEEENAEEQTMEEQVVGECVVTDEGRGILEIKNLAVAPAFQRRGYGQRLIDFIAETYQNGYAILQVGTGDSPLTIPFYEACGFWRSHVVKDFFVKNYDHPIYENGVLLTDMVYLRRRLAGRADLCRD